MVRRFRKRICGLTPLKRFIYLISPNKIDQSFYATLDRVLSFKNVKYFQLRLKNISPTKFISISKRIKKITNRYAVKFIINDYYNLVNKTNADGCHMGQLDGPLKIARKKLKRKILGVTCHDSQIFAHNATLIKADYVAFGSFFKSRLKPKAKKANIKILKWAKKNIKKPIIVIGGINSVNYKKLCDAGAKYIALCSFIWDNPKLKPEQAIKKFK